MQPHPAHPMKLRARDRGDLEVISALLQDALVPLVDVTYLRREKRFVLVANRFRWPEAETLGPEAETLGPEAETLEPEAETLGPEAETLGPEAERLGPEAERAAGSPMAPPPGRDASFEDAEGRPPFERVNCGICFDRVVKVRSTGIERGEREQILNLLAIESEAGAVMLVFSGGGVIRLEVSGLLCHMEDLGEGWPTRWRPTHDDQSTEPA